jgi:hypothetical protein
MTCPVFTSNACLPAAYRQLKTQQRIEAHIFVAFPAYCLHVTLRARLKPLAPGLTPRAVLVLPPQSPPRITAPGKAVRPRANVV